MSCAENIAIIADLSGDITNFLLTGTYSAEDQTSEAGRPYLRAQAEGQVRDTARASGWLSAW